MNFNFKKIFKRGKTLKKRARTTCWLTPEIVELLREASRLTGLSQAHIIRQSLLRECNEIVGKLKKLET